jgi:thiol-disulfide isomerase/thioredoxin
MGSCIVAGDQSTIRHAMKMKLLAVLFVAALLPCQFASAADAGNATNELHALVAKVNADIQAGKRTEAALADDLKQFDALLAEHKGEVTDAVARILYMKATLYSEVIGDTAKAEALMNQLKTEFKDTAFVADLEKQEAREAAAKKLQASLVEGAQFPDFNETDVVGKPLSIANDKGKVVLIDFWATWCPPCRAELPNVIATYQKYHDQGFDIIGISLDQNRTNLLDFIKENKMTWPQYFDGRGWENKLAVKYGIEAIPMDFLLDGNGKIIGKDLRGEALPQAVAKALAK